MDSKDTTKSKIKQIFKIIPWFPLSGLIFYFMIWALWSLGIIPPPVEIVPFLESLYNRLGLFGIFLTSFLEGIAYIGLYVPGTTIIFLAIVFSDGSFLSLVYISLTITLSLTLVSILNYVWGKFFASKKQRESKKEGVEKNIFLSIIHPNLLAFYFFHRGLKKKDFWKVFLFPLIIFPYAFIIAYIVSFSSEFVKDSVVGNPYVFLLCLVVWLMTATVLENKKDLRKGLGIIYKHLRR